MGEGVEIRQIFLVFGWDLYEFPYDPIKAFESEEDAKAFVGLIADYQQTRPTYPAEDALDEELDLAQAEIDAWIAAHPAKDHHWRDGFSVMPIYLEYTP